MLTQYRIDAARFLVLMKNENVVKIGKKKIRERVPVTHSEAEIIIRMARYITGMTTVIKDKLGVTVHDLDDLIRLKPLNVNGNYFNISSLAGIVYGKILEKKSSISEIEVFKAIIDQVLETPIKNWYDVQLHPHGAIIHLVDAHMESLPKDTRFENNIGITNNQFMTISSSGVNNRHRIACIDLSGIVHNWLSFYTGTKGWRRQPRIATLKEVRTEQYVRNNVTIVADCRNKGILYTDINIGGMSKHRQDKTVIDINADNNDFIIGSLSVFKKYLALQEYDNA